MGNDWLLFRNSPNYNKEESDKIVFELIDKLRHTIVFIIMTLIVSVKIINVCPYKRLKYGTNETLIASVVKFVRFFSSLWKKTWVSELC